MSFPPAPRSMSAGGSFDREAASRPSSAVLRHPRGLPSPRLCDTFPGLNLVLRHVSSGPPEKSCSGGGSITNGISARTHRQTMEPDRPHRKGCLRTSPPPSPNQELDSSAIAIPRPTTRSVAPGERCTGSSQGRAGAGPQRSGLLPRVRAPREAGGKRLPGVPRRLGEQAAAAAGGARRGAEGGRNLPAHSPDRRNDPHTNRQTSLPPRGHLVIDSTEPAARQPR